MQNTDIRLEIRRAGLRHWQIAHELGLNDGNFSRKLRLELSADDKDKIRKIILSLKEGCAAVG